MSCNNNNSKVKGILKGLRFISQIFDNEKEAEIQIGNPTDVKHVAHIGSDGPAECAPSWMNEFKSVPGMTSAPLNHDTDVHSKGPDHAIQHSEENMRECQAKEKSDRPRNHHKKTSKHSYPNDSCNEDMHMDMDSFQHQGNDLPPRNQSNHHKKAHHHSKISKDGSSVSGGSSKSRSKTHHHHHDVNSNQLSPSRSSGSKSRTKRMSLKDEQLQRESCETIS